MVPLSICCILSGFLTLHFERERVRSVITVYCWCSTALFSIVFLVALLLSVQLGKLNAVNTFIVTAYLMLFTYYRVKHLWNTDTYRTIVENIAYVDKSLGYKPPHSKAYGIVYTLVILLNIIYMYQYIYERSRLLCHRDERKRFCTTLGFVRNASIHVPLVCILLQFVYLMNALKQRIQLICQAVETMAKGNNRFTAWAECSVFSMYEHRIRELVNDKEFRLKELRYLYMCINEAFHSVKQFYSLFISVHFSVYIYTCSLQLYRSLLHLQYSTVAFHAFKAVMSAVLPMYVCVSATAQFRKTDSCINNFFSTQRRYKTARSRNVNWVYECAHRNTRVSCGIFDIDLPLMSMVLNFVVMLLTTMFSANYEGK